tara:strand:- start:936 stop:1175 length:240 start_codon:yes stop_codon:yes gene_type:complete
MRNFAVYTKDDCPYCSKIKQVLDGKQIQYREYKLGVHYTREAFQREFGRGCTFPQVLVNSEKLGGCTDTVKYLQEKNLI